MKLVKFVTYLLFRYYSKGPTNNVAYIKAICTAVLLILINIWIVLILIGRTDIVPDTANVSKGMKYLKMALYTLPLFLFFFFFVKEKDLKIMRYDESKIKMGYRILWSYLIISFVAMIVLMFVFAPARETNETIHHRLGNCDFKAVRLL
jgi:hypothetical protein